MNDPRILSLFSIVFTLLGAYNLFQGNKSMRVARMSGTPQKWYKQIKLLIGTEYILLACVFLLSAAYSFSIFSTSLRNILFPVYLLLLVGAAIFAGLVIRRGILNARMLRAQARSGTSTARSNGARLQTSEREAEMTGQQRAAYLERKRERRRNAAAARRRRAGKA